MPVSLTKGELRGVLKSTINAIEAASDSTAKEGPPPIKAKDLQEIVALKEALTQAVMALQSPGGQPLGGDTDD